MQLPPAGNGRTTFWADKQSWGSDHAKEGMVAIVADYFTQLFTTSAPISNGC